MSRRYLIQVKHLSMEWWYPGDQRVRSRKKTRKRLHRLRQAHPHLRYRALEVKDW